MSLIQCTDPCVYQLDGRAPWSGPPPGTAGGLGCVNFVPRSAPARDPGPGRMEKAPEEL